jgi:hypothetical protein
MHGSPLLHAAHSWHGSVYSCKLGVCAHDSSRVSSKPKQHEAAMPYCLLVLALLNTVFMVDLAEMELTSNSSLTALDKSVRSYSAPESECGWRPMENSRRQTGTRLAASPRSAASGSHE